MYVVVVIFFRFAFLYDKPASQHESRNLVNNPVYCSCSQTLTGSQVCHQSGWNYVESI